MKNVRFYCLFAILLFIVSCSQTEDLLDNKYDVSVRASDDGQVFEKDLPIYTLRDIPIYIISRTYPTYGKYLTTDNYGNLSYSDKNSSFHQEWVFDSNDKTCWAPEDNQDERVYYGLYSLGKSSQKYIGCKFNQSEFLSSRYPTMMEKTRTPRTADKWQFRRMARIYSDERGKYYRLGSIAFDSMVRYLGYYPTNSNKPYIVHWDEGTLFEIMPVDNFKLKSMSWFVEPGDIITALPAFADQATVINNSAATAKMTARFSRKASENSSFSQSEGFSFTIESSAKVGVPIIAEGSINTSSTTSANWQYGSSETLEDTRSYDFEVTLPPHTSVSVKILVQMNKLSASYTAEFIGERSNRILKQSGKWHGVQAGQIYYEIVDNQTNKVLSTFNKIPEGPIVISK